MATMSSSVRTLLLFLAASLGLVAGVRGDKKDEREETKPSGGAACAAAVDDFFANEVWAKVGARSCLECHKPGGDAEDSDFVLADPDRAQGRTRTRRCGTTAMRSSKWRGEAGDHPPNPANAPNPANPANPACC